MSSYRPRSYSRPLHRKRTRWKTRVFLILLLLAACWYGFPYLWEKGKAFFAPKVVVQVSQEEAMNKLRELSMSWELTSEKLKELADGYHEKFEWMESRNAQDAATWLLAQELDFRGMHEQSQPMVVELLVKKMESSAQLTEDQRKALASAVIEWGDKLLDRGANDSAEKLLSAVQSMKAGDELYVSLLLKGIDLYNRKGDVDGVLGLTKRLHGEDVLNVLKSPEMVRVVADRLLLEDALKLKKTGQPSLDGTALAFSLLEKNSLGASPEMGRILLARLKDKLSGGETLSKEQGGELRKELDNILVCFRASGEDMAYIPETMLAMARLYMAEGNIPYTLLWADRASGAAMALGVDTPRVLGEGSLKNEITALKDKCKKVLKSQASLKEAEENIRKADRLAAENDWDGVRIEAVKNLEKLKGTKFSEGLIPIAGYQLALSRIGQSNWGGACATLESLKTEWAQISDEELTVLNSNLKKNGHPDLYKVVHRKLAEAYLKQDMKTRAAETLAMIGEELPKEAPETRGRSSRRSR